MTDMSDNVQKAFNDHREAQQIRATINTLLDSMKGPDDGLTALWAEVFDAAEKHAEFLEHRAYNGYPCEHGYFNTHGNEGTPEPAWTCPGRADFSDLSKRVGS